jgi:hypothetical protein
MKLKQLLTEIKRKRKGEKKKNGIPFISVEEFLAQSVNEVAIKGTHKPISDDKLQPYLQRSKKKETLPKDINLPFIHNKNLKFKDENDNILDADELRREIMTRPPTILQQNDKMKHSATGGEEYYNIGLPALRGLAVDEDTNEFIIVNTCPGAGTCLKTCYAMAGSYVMYPRSSMYRSRMVNWILNDPEGFKAKLSGEIANRYKNVTLKRGITLGVRWHDAGDFFHPTYTQIAVDIALQFPDVNFYAYTKTASVMNLKEPNFDPRFSDGARNSETKKVDFKKDRSGRIVPTELFKDLRTGENDETGRWGITDFTELKRRVADYYDIDVETVIMDVDYTTLNRGKQENQWNVIVVPGGSDAPANDKNNLNIFNLQH